MRIYISVFITTTLLMFSCKTKIDKTTSNGNYQHDLASQPNENLATEVNLIFLDSLQASEAILVDESCDIFNRLGRLEMCIQLKNNYSADIPTTSILSDYKDHVQKDASDFSVEEKKWLNQIWSEATRLCNKIDKNILPAQIKLIKSKGTYYGTDAFFTRDNIIVVPRENLERRSETGMLSVLLHEIFHIYSRYNPAKQEELYQLIGYKKIGDSIDLKMNEDLSKRILHNPDGVNFAYAIELKDEKNSYDAISIISSTLDKYHSSKPNFFDYLHFDLYEVKSDEKGVYTVISDEEGQPTLPPESMLSFFEQIGSNTQYIIHPDEILADNFMILALSLEDESSIEDLDEKGKMLLSKIRKVLQE